MKFYIYCNSVKIVCYNKQVMCGMSKKPCTNPAIYKRWGVLIMALNNAYLESVYEKVEKRNL